MKAQALYHLMQLRARALGENLPGSNKAVLEEIQSSIKIQRKPGTYILNWSVKQTDYSITLESDPFRFYEKGDNAQRNAKRVGDLNYRTYNWNAALELWRDIFKASNLDHEPITDDGRLAFGDFSKVSSNSSLYQNMGIALLFSLLSIINHSLVETSLLFIAISALLLYANNLSTVHLRKPLHIIEKLIIAAGCMIPLYFGVGLIGGIFIATGLYLLGIGERQDKFKALLFCLSGISLGLAIYSMGVFAITLTVVVSAILVVVSIIDSQRISMSNAGLFIAGSILAWLAMYTLIEMGSISTYRPQEIILNQQYLNWIVAASLAMIFLGCALWWIIGVQYYLLPWLSLLALFVAALVLLCVDRNDTFVMLGIFCGFSIFVVERVFAGFFTSIHGN